MALDTVQNYLDRARALLQDTVEPYRYPSDDLVQALNMAIMECRRIRPDIMMDFFATDLPEFSLVELTAAVPIDKQYRTAFVYYITGHAQLRDEEETTDARAAAYLGKFIAQLLTTAA